MRWIGSIAARRAVLAVAAAEFPDGENLMRVLPVIVAAGVLLTAGAATAQTSIPPALPANPTPGVIAPMNNATPVQITDDTIVCKYEQYTGTLLVERVCRTQRAWKFMRDAAQEFMEFGFRGAHQKDDGS
jgi:hypothetical protein